MATVERGGASHSGFSQWRANRPFWGGALLIVASLIIAYVPAQFAFELLLIGGAFTMIGLVFAFLVFLSGVAALLKPDLATLAGIAGIGFSVLSLVGALGGLLVGALLGLVGGSLCIAWESPTETERRERDTATTEPITDADYEWESSPATGEAVTTDEEGRDWSTDVSDGSDHEVTAPRDVADDEQDSTFGDDDSGTQDSSVDVEEQPTFSWEEDPYAEDDNNET